MNIIDFKKISDYMETEINEIYRVLRESNLSNEINYKFYNQYGSFIEDEEEPEYKLDRKAPNAHIVISDLSGNVSDNATFLQYYRTVGISLFVPLAEIESGERLMNDIVDDYRTRKVTVDEKYAEMTIPNIYTKSDKISYSGHDYIILELQIIFNFIEQLGLGQDLKLTVDGIELPYTTLSSAMVTNTTPSLTKEPETSIITNNYSRALSIECLMLVDSEILEILLNEYNTGTLATHEVNLSYVSDKDIKLIDVTRTLILGSLSIVSATSGLITLSIDFNNAKV